MSLSSDWGSRCAALMGGVRRREARRDERHTCKNPRSRRTGDRGFRLLARMVRRASERSPRGAAGPHPLQLRSQRPCELGSPLAGGPSAVASHLTAGSPVPNPASCLAKSVPFGGDVRSHEAAQPLTSEAQDTYGRDGRQDLRSPCYIIVFPSLTACTRIIRVAR